VKFWNLDLIFAAIMLKEMMQINPRANRAMRGCVIAGYFWKSNMSQLWLQLQVKVASQSCWPQLLVRVAGQK